MAPEEPPAETVVIRRRPLWQRIVKWVGILIGSVALLIVAALFALNTDPGRRFLADRIAAFSLASGLNMRIGRIDGSIYGAMILRDVQVRDQHGAFATASQINLDWRPFAYFRNHVDIRSVMSPLVRVSRLPALKPVPRDPNAPWLPDLIIDVGRLKVDRIEFAPAVTGQRHIATLDGSAHIADRRAQITLNSQTLRAAGLAGGDLLKLKLDAVPDDNKLGIDLHLNAPADGLVVGLAGLKQPMTLAVAGNGSWKAWQGRATGTLGGATLADLKLAAHDGLFQLRGPTQPGLILKGPVERLAAPHLDLALDARLDNRVADTKLQLRSSALAFESNGKIDLGHNRFENFRATAQLLTPGAIAPNLNGRDVRAAVAIDGPFARPVVDYKLQAAALGFGTTVAQQLYAEGRARISTERMLVPVNARVARITGLNEAAGGLATNVRLTGNLAISGTQILSDDLRLRSDRVDATAIVVADLGTGRYTGALKGRINDYEVRGLGIIDLSTNANLYAARQGGWGVRGKVVATTRRLFNTGVRDFLGGNATMSAELDFGPSGTLTFRALNLRAPRFRIESGSGRFSTNGQLLVNASAWSADYGPLTAQVTGSLTAPAVLLRAPKPGLGVGMVDLVANIRGDRRGWAVVASGGTNYGPFSADVLIATSAPLTIDIRKGRFAGMDIAGHIQQTGAGPFAGRVTFAGSGVNGVAQLSAAGKIQAAAIDARAYQAKIPGQAGLTIGRALIKGNVILYPDTPQVVADAQIANVRSGSLVVTKARARIDYRGGHGTAQILANGSTGVGFTVAANARLSPHQIVAAVQGQGNGVKFRTASPARVAIADGEYKLAPVRLNFDRGSALVAGSYGKGLALQARLEKFDVGVVNAFVPGLGINGTANGSIDFAQSSDGSFPAGVARLEISDFTRSSIATVSVPVNISLQGKLVPQGGDLRALVKNGNTTIGRVVATLQPIGSGGSWQERLMAAPLGGGIRYNGPATVLFSIAGLTEQQVTGPIGVAVDFSGRLEHPQLTGIVRATNLIYDNETYGTRLTGLSIDGRFTSDRLELTRLQATAGDGTVSASGNIGLAAVNNFPIDVTVVMRNARLAKSDALGATATGQIHVTHGANGGRIQGRIEVPEARYEIIRQGAANVTELTGVRRKSDLVREASDQPPPPDFGTFELQLNVHADNRLFVTGMGLESEWEANLFVRGNSANPRISGEARIVRGTYEFAGKRLEITRGRIDFSGGSLNNPQLDISASTTAEGVTAIVNVAGSAQNPQITFTSTPALPQDEVLSRLLFGSSVTNLSATEALQLAAALNTLSGGGGGLNPLGKLRSSIGFDRLRILSPDEASGRETSLAAGKYITNNIYIEIITDARGFTATQLEVSLSRALSILSQTGSFSGSSVSVRYSRDY